MQLRAKRARHSLRHSQRLSECNSPLQSLPNQLVGQILGSLSLRDALAARATCKWWRGTKTHFTSLFVDDAEDETVKEALNVCCTKRLRELQVSVGYKNPQSLTHGCLIDILELGTSGALSGLRALSIQGPCSIDGSCFEHLVQLKSLEKLEFAHCFEITGVGANYLAALLCLTSFSLINCDVRDPGLAHIAEIKNLQELNVNNNSRLTKVGWAHVCSLPHLKSLNVHDCNSITDADLAGFACLPGLTALDIGNNQRITETGFASIGAMANLRKLDLSCCFTTDCAKAGLKHIVLLSCLEDINLSFMNECDLVILSKILANQNLKIVSLMWCQSLTSEMLEISAKLPLLTELHLSGTRPVTSDFLKHLRGNQTITKLLLNYCTLIDDEALRCVSEIVNLQVLDLACCELVTDSGMAYLARLIHLNRLDLGHRLLHVTHAAVQQLKLQLPGIVIDGSPSLRAVQQGHSRRRVGIVN